MLKVNFFCQLGFTFRLVKLLNAGYPWIFAPVTCSVKRLNSRQLKDLQNKKFSDAPPPRSAATSLSHQIAVMSLTD